ncbi:TIR domain-containing protein [Lachnospiraceae bacterium NE2001]|nr:TIR domain-containing protein [Lachnospiraceae bacterium NE2001]
MAVIKCKMCGGELKILPDSTICECEYCGSKQTIPNTDDEKRLKLYERANKLRFENEFDKAAGVYESIVSEYQDEAEAYWGLVLCKYGIEYVDDPKTGKKIPTCHRSSFDSVMDDGNFDLVMENSDTVARGIYREEAKQIEELRKGIVEVSSKEEPYDIFICYKETADDGQRTIDSVIAQDVYQELTDKGYRVFFSRITLEDKLGQEYEPYIFAALNSAKIMLAFGTCYDYYNAVWVKNEWSRFLQLMEAGQKKTLIPCFKDIDAYDMPKEFARLQAQDMGKVGAMQDLIRGIDKIFGRDKNDVIQDSSVDLHNFQNSTDEKVSSVGVGGPNSPSIDSLIKRAQGFVKDHEWKKAYEYSERILDIDPENGSAYLVELLCKFEETYIMFLPDKAFISSAYDKAYRYGDESTKEELARYKLEYQQRKAKRKEEIIERKKKEEEENLKKLEDIKSLMASANNVGNYQSVISQLKNMRGFGDSSKLIKECEEKIQELEKKNKEDEMIRILEERKAILESGYKYRVLGFVSSFVIACISFLFLYFYITSLNGICMAFFVVFLIIAISIVWAELETKKELGYVNNSLREYKTGYEEKQIDNKFSQTDKKKDYFLAVGIVFAAFVIMFIVKKIINPDITLWELIKSFFFH